MKKKNLLLWAIGILFVMSFLPGTGTKAANQQAIVATEYTCSANTDCPVCTGAGIEKFNETDPTFLGELSYANCVKPSGSSTGVCHLSDACLVWDCPNGASSNCKSIKKTILENTFGLVNKNPLLLIGIIALVVVYFILP